MFTDFLARWRNPRGGAAGAGLVARTVHLADQGGMRAAANEPSLQLGLPFGPLPTAPLGRRIDSTPLGRRVDSTPSVRRIEPTLPVRPLGRLDGRGPVRLGSPAAGCAASPGGAVQLRVDAADGRRAVVIGAMAEVCATLDRLVAAEEAERVQRSASPS